MCLKETGWEGVIRDKGFDQQWVGGELWVPDTQVRFDAKIDGDMGGGGFPIFSRRHVGQFCKSFWRNSSSCTLTPPPNYDRGPTDLQRHKFRRLVPLSYSTRISEELSVKVGKEKSIHRDSRQLLKGIAPHSRIPSSAVDESKCPRNSMHLWKCYKRLHMLTPYVCPAIALFFFLSRGPFYCKCLHHCPCPISEGVMPNARHSLPSPFSLGISLVHELRSCISQDQTVFG